MDMETFALRADGCRAKLYKTALLYLGDASAAAEALDEAVYRGVKGCARLRQEEYFDTWLMRILMNVCCSELRRRSRESARWELPETDRESFDALPLREAIARLPRELKELVILRYFDGCTLRETAEILRIPQGTAATRQRRALSLLRLELEEEGSQ